VNSVYAGWHVDDLLDYMNEVSKENDTLRQLLIKSLRIVSRPEHFDISTQEEIHWGAEIQAFLQDD
jgi:hypothetical protein